MIMKRGDVDSILLYQSVILVVVVGVQFVGNYLALWAGAIQ